MSFKKQVVLITGGSSGIGAATAEVFAKEGANIAIVGRNEDNLKKVAKSCEKLGSKGTLIIKADLANDEELKTVVKKTIDKFGKLDVLVNNAGILTFGSLLEENLIDVYDKTMNTNLRAAVFITNLAAPFLVKSKGNIVNVSSILGVTCLGEPRYLSYCISKAGMDHFTRGAALELAAAGVRVNTVSPGPTRTEVLTNAGSDASWEQISKDLNIARIAEPEEVGNLIMYLASDKAKSITGANYSIDCGTLLKK